MEIYPNPADQSVTIPSRQFANPKCTIFNVSGAQMVDRNMQDGTVIIGVSQWNPGVYIVKIQDSTSTKALYSKLPIQ